MSKLINNVSSFVNDPSLQLMNYFFPFSKQSENGFAMKIQSASSNETIKDAIQSSSKEVQFPESFEIIDIEVSSKAVQAGGGLKRYRKAYTQCSGLLNDKIIPKKESRTTAIESNILKPVMDCSTGGGNIFVVDNGTDPLKDNVCQEHRETLLKLINWNETHEFNATYLSAFKAMIKKIVNFFNQDKIGEIPQKPLNYENTRYVLYKCVSTMDVMQQGKPHTAKEKVSLDEKKKKKRSKKGERTKKIKNESSI